METRMVIFGCGYLGSELASQALSHGMRVTALTRNSETASKLRQLGAHQVVETELADNSWHQQIDPAQDLVVNCVGASGGSIEGYLESYLEGQKSVARWAESGSIGTFVFTSSASVYPQTNRSLVNEGASCEGVSDRGALLLASEIIGFPGPASIKRSFILRLAGIYGPGRHVFLSRLRTGVLELPGNADAFLNLIHRDDACSAIWAVLNSPPERLGRIYNVSDGYPIQRKELAAWLASKIGTEEPVFTGKPRANQGTDASESPPNRKIDNGRLREELDWEPCYPSFREGYEALLAEE